MYGTLAEISKSEDLWLKVAQYIDEQYIEESIETIYISGDGALTVIPVAVMIK